MNETKVNTKIGDETLPGEKNAPGRRYHAEPCHQYDDWLLPQAKNDSNALFASRVLDISRGAKVITSILSAHLVDLNVIAGGGGDSTRVLLSENDTEALARLAVFALGELHEMVTDQVDRLNSQAEAGARA